MTDFPLFPERASTIAESVDHVYFLLVGVSAFFSILIFLLIFYFAIRYRRKRADEIPQPVHGSMRLELFWSITPGIIALGIFAWGTVIFFRNAEPPPGAMDIYVVGKQWMWKLQHPDGRREINELHVPVGRPVKLTMASEDVIHSFYVPAFRVKMDVLPGRYTTLWFQPTKPGKYHLFCAEYCGNQHSGMKGWVYVMEPEDYGNWAEGIAAGESMSQTGERLFQQFGCHTCHRTDAPGRGPVLTGVFGSRVQLQSGETVTADEAYLRESILRPAAKVVAGFRPLMPTFQGQIGEEQILALITYIKSLAPAERVDREK
jgi:cytochrome c oxidase subunit 2